MFLVVGSYIYKKVKNIKYIRYPGKFSIQIESLKNFFFDAQLFVIDNRSFELEISYSSPLIETVELTNFIEHSLEFYDIQGIILIGSKKHEISLLHCSLSSNNWSESFDGKDEKKCFHNRYVKINVGAYILDAKVNSNSPISKAEFKFSALSVWADMLDGGVKNNVLSIPKKKEWKTIANNEDELIVKNYFEKEKHNNQVSYIQTASLIVNFKESKNFLEYLEYGRIYNDFFVLMTGRKSDIENFYLVFGVNTKNNEVLVNHKTCNPEFSEKSFFHFEYLTKNLSTLNNWYSYYRATNLAYALFFDTFHFRERYMTDMLLDAYIRSFEGMITKFYSLNDYFIRSNKNKKIINSIKDAIIPQIDEILENYQSEKYKIDNYLNKYKQTILDSFSHSYELSFKTRINLFLDLHKDYFVEDFEKHNRDEVVKQMIQFRNAYAHADDSKLTVENIFTLIKFIKKMILVHLYSDVLNISNFSIDLRKLV